MTIANKSLALAVAGIVTVAAVTPSFARSWRPWAAAGAGFAAGAAIGAAAASSRAFYGPGYGSYAYAPGYGSYAYAPGYQAYAYSPGYMGYVNPTPVFRAGEFGSYDSGFKSCATDGNYNKTDYVNC